MRAETAVPVNEVIAIRRSPRSLDESAPLSDTDLLGILEAARWAPSAFNGQPWRFFVGKRGDTTFNQILASLVEFNQGWAKNVVVIAIGKQDSPEKLPTALAERELAPRGRKSLAEIVLVGLPQN
jgi:nitroreductase